MRLFYFFILAFLVLFDTSCTREINIQQVGPVIQDGQIGGKIVLPINNKVDTIGLKVMSAISSTAPVNGGYAVDTTGKTSTTFLLNNKGQVLLMGYNYPGQKVSDVSAESTALAFLMNTLTMRSLSFNGRIEAIEKIKSTPSYGKLVEAVENSLKAGKAVSDTTNTELIKAIGTVFESTISGLRTSKTEGHKDPIIIKTTNTELQLKNNLVAHCYVAGIYKDGVLKQTVTIGGYTFFARGVVEGLEAIFNDGYGIPESVDYPMSEEGEYEIKIRSGRPGSNDGTIEYRKARTENVAKFILRQIAESLPIPEGCAGAALTALKNRISNVLQAKEVVLNNASTSTDYAFLATDIAADVFEDTKEILQECAQVPEESFEFFKGMGKIVKVLGKALNIADAVMLTANIYSHSEDLFKSRGSIDTCFQVVGLKTFKCGEEITYLVKDEGGNNQKGESGKQLVNPLKVKVTYEDGKPAMKTVVKWVVKSGGGMVSNPTSITNNEGIAETKWTIGSGKQALEAFVNKKDESTSVNFLASSNTADVAKIEIVSKNGLGGFMNPIKVKVTDSDGKPIEKVEIDWSATSGIILGTSDGFTDEQGIAGASITLKYEKAFSMKISTKTSEPKSVVFTIRPFLLNEEIVYIHPDDDREVLPNPFRAFVVDIFLIPIPGIQLKIKAVGGATNDYSESSSNDLGLINVRRPNATATQFDITWFDRRTGKVNGFWANVTIK